MVCGLNLVVHLLLPGRVSFVQGQRPETSASAAANWVPKAELKTSLLNPELLTIESHVPNKTSSPTSGHWTRSLKPAFGDGSAVGLRCNTLRVQRTQVSGVCMSTTLGTVPVAAGRILSLFG